VQISIIFTNIFTIRNYKQTLYNDLVDWIHNHGEGWSSQLYTNTQEKEFIISLTETIWYIDMCNYKNIAVIYQIFFWSFLIVQI
jgi:hypothetical protein